MTRKYRAPLLAATMALILGNSASAAERATGLYFEATVGMASADLGSKSELDQSFTGPIVEDLLDDGFEDVTFESSLDDSDIGWGIQIGYQFHRNFAAEIGYVNLGEMLYQADIETTSGGDPFPFEASLRLKSAGPIAAAVGRFPINERFDVRATAGLYFAETKVRDRVRDLAFEENRRHVEHNAGEQEFFAGIGASWNINESYSLLFEYRRFLDVGDDRSGEQDVDLLAVSMLFR
ncbi:MAG TPA: outer membrane beta-barrel protein [Steroidobacteraceae bacterium]|jgi:opacity protein-like surface antigen|nr:outer membrane beta-barrel protein [Steroidobacteraceae bacterium]